MHHFHTNIFARPLSVASGPTATLRGVKLATLVAPGGGPPLFERALLHSFEEVQEQLACIPRMDVEPDGYFLVAGGEANGQRWQIDGHLFEYEGSMHRVEIRGSCDDATFDELLRVTGWPALDVVFQLVREGVTLSEEDFRRWAARRDAQAR